MRPAQIYSLRNDQHSSLFFAHSLIHRRNFSSVLYSIRFQKALPACYHHASYSRSPLSLSLASRESNVCHACYVCVCVCLCESLYQINSRIQFLFLSFFLLRRTQWSWSSSAMERSEHPNRALDVFIFELSMHIFLLFLRSAVDLRLSWIDIVHCLCWSWQRKYIKSGILPIRMANIRTYMNKILYYSIRNWKPLQFAL